VGAVRLRIEPAVGPDLVVPVGRNRSAEEEPPRAPQLDRVRGILAHRYPAIEESELLSIEIEHQIEVGAVGQSGEVPQLSIFSQERSEARARRNLLFLGGAPRAP